MEQTQQPSLHLRRAQPEEFPFLQTILYEAVFWQESPTKPALAEGLAYPEVQKVLAHWGERTGDTCVVAHIAGQPVGAAWFRYWQADDAMRGYLDAQTPVLVIGVLDGYRRQGIATQLIAWLVEAAARQAIPRISLMVAKDNHARHLYTQQGFVKYAATNDSLLMVRKITF